MAGIRSLKKLFPGVARGGCTQLELTETLLPVNIVNLVHMCLRTNIRGGRQLSMFMSENICTMVDLFDKAVAGGGGGAR